MCIGLLPKPTRAVDFPSGLLNILEDTTLAQENRKRRKTHVLQPGLKRWFGRSQAWSGISKVCSVLRNDLPAVRSYRSCTIMMKRVYCFGLCRP